MITHRAAKARAIAKRLGELAEQRSKYLTAEERPAGNMRVRDLVADSLSDMADIVLSLCEDAEPYEEAHR